MDEKLLSAMRRELIAAASEPGRHEAVNTLLGFGVSTDTVGAGNMTPLMLACKAKLVETVEVLIDHGANINVQDSNGSTALMHAYQCCETPEIPRLLHDAGADMRIVNKTKQVAMHYALEAGRVDNILLALAHDDMAHDPEKVAPFTGTAEVMTQVALGMAPVWRLTPAAKAMKTGRPEKGGDRMAVEKK